MIADRDPLRVRGNVAVGAKCATGFIASARYRIIRASLRSQNSSPRNQACSGMRASANRPAHAIRYCCRQMARIETCAPAKPPAALPPRCIERLRGADEQSSVPTCQSTDARCEASRLVQSSVPPVNLLTPGARRAVQSAFFIPGFDTVSSKRGQFSLRSARDKVACRTSSAMMTTSPTRTATSTTPPAVFPLGS